jgi:alpha-tubulin suppressor-like RCC1 family protein
MVGAGTSGCIAIAGGYKHSVVLKDTGAIYATGQNAQGQLGTGNNTTTNTLTAMVGQGTSSCTAIAAGQYHSVVLKDTGAVYATGLNTDGQLGTGNNTTTNTLTAMVGQGASGCTAIAAGAYHSVVLKDTGAVYATGQNTDGQLGTENNTNTNTLTAMVGAGTPSCTAIAAGGGYSFVLQGSGAVFSTGNNSTGQLGTGNNFPTNILTGISGTSWSLCLLK